MANKGMLDDLKVQVAQIFGMSDEQAGKVVADGLEKEKAAKAAAPVGTEAGKKDTPDPAGDAPDAAELEQVAQMLADGQEAKQRVEAVEKSLEEIAEAIKVLTEAVVAQAKAVELPKEETQEKLLPRGTAAALIELASRKGTPVSSEEVQKDAAKQAEALDATKGPDPTTDPLGWMGAQAGMPIGQQPKQ